MAGAYTRPCFSSALAVSSTERLTPPSASQGKCEALNKKVDECEPLPCDHRQTVLPFYCREGRVPKRPPANHHIHATATAAAAATAAATAATRSHQQGLTQIILTAQSDCLRMGYIQRTSEPDCLRMVYSWCTSVSVHTR